MTRTNSIKDSKELELPKLLGLFAGIRALKRPGNPLLFTHNTSHSAVRKDGVRGVSAPPAPLCGSMQPTPRTALLLRLLARTHRSSAKSRACRYVPTKYAPPPATTSQAALALVGSLESLEVIGKLLRNIVVAPAEEKYRRVRLTNAKARTIAQSPDPHTSLSARSGGLLVRVGSLPVGACSSKALRVCIADGTSAASEPVLCEARRAAGCLLAW